MKRNRKPKTRKLRHSYLLTVLSYDPLVGDFRWKVKRNGLKPTLSAGWKNYDGYMQICVDRQTYWAHRLAWFYVYRRWPKGELDHINGIRDDNCIENLRETKGSRTLQAANRKRRKDSLTGFKGVSGRGNRWIGRISKDNTRFYLGCFGTPEEAHAAYMKAAKKLFGEFARAM